MRSPIKWAGGKSRLRNQIINILPEHTCYVEPFCGAAWVLFGKQPSPVEIINDIDGELINFFRVIKQRPEDFIHSFDLELISRQQYNDLAALNPENLNEIERAHRFYYLIMAGWGGELHYPRFQTSITDGGHGNRLIGAIKTLRQRIEPVHQRLSTIIIENLDWRECITRYDRPGVVMYIDPPYPGNGVNYAHNIRDWAEHEAMADVLAGTQSRWILSSYDTEKIRELYQGYHIIPVEIASGMRKTKQNTERVIIQEVLITNYDISAHQPTPADELTQTTLL
ncbi:MAG: DNA adenine methylase [Anaerolineaceae bacterium]|nr:DNA adenine methylase [Anaerolineaceae bacterium]